MKDKKVRGNPKTRFFNFLFYSRTKVHSGEKRKTKNLKRKIKKVRKVRIIFQSGKMKGKCSKMRIVYGVVTVSDKGQIAIPVDLRKDLDIKQGDKLFVIKRRDEAGFTLIKLEKIDELMYKLQEDEEFFKKRR